MSEIDQTEPIEAEVVDDGPDTERKLAAEGKKERTALAKRYFHPFIREADDKLAKLPGIKRGEASAMVRALMRGAEMMERSALMEILFLYSFSGMSITEIAKHMKVDRRLISSLMLDPRYSQAYGAFRKEVVGKIADALTQRVSETMIDALELKITLMRKSKSDWLRNQIANEILKMGTDITHGKSEGVSDKLQAIWERAVKKVTADGTTITETQRIQKALE